MDTEYLNLPGQITDMLSRSERCMWSTNGIGQKIFGWGFDSQHKHYRKLIRTLNAMLENDVLLCCGTVNGGDVWMLRVRDWRVSDRDRYDSATSGELPF